jgi:Carbohydrate family 9 binding domain-like
VRILSIIALLLVGCVDKGAGPQPKKIEPGFVGTHLLVAPPALTQTSNVVLGGQVIYLGNTVESTRIAPGGQVKITHYWKVIAPPGYGWKPFTLFRGEAGAPDFMALGDTDMSIAHGPATWRGGEIIEDPQEFTLRPDWRSPKATLSIGLISSGAHGVGDRMAAEGPTVVDRAVTARVFDVDLSKAPPPPGTIYVPFARGPIVVDGIANEVGWTGAITSPEFPTGEGSPDPVGKATARLTWDEQNLYAFITVTDSDVFSEYKNHDDPLWKADCVEMFIDADGNKRGYVELQVNPNNATFDSWFAQGRAAKGDEAWNSGMVTAVTMRGTADKSGDTDQGWDVEIAIPWAAVKGREEQMGVIIPPRVGDRWKLNVVRVDKKTGDKDPSVSSWNRITYGDFHALDRMLTVVFADPNGGTAPGTPVGAAAVPAAGSGAGSGSGEGSGSAGSGSAAPPVAPTRLGSGATVPNAELAKNIATIAISAKGEIRINGALVKDADLETVLRSLAARDKNLELRIELEPGAPRERSAKLSELAKTIGLTKVSVTQTAPTTP